MKLDQGINGLKPRDWLLAESVRRLEESTGEFRLDEAATREDTVAHASRRARASHTNASRVARVTEFGLDN